MCDVVATGRDTFTAFLGQHLKSPKARQQAELLRQAFSTYSDAEVEAIEGRLHQCRDRFVSEGSGPQRKTGLCSVLYDVKEGNGGSIPVDEWEQIYQELGCGGSTSVA